MISPFVQHQIGLAAFIFVLLLIALSNLKVLRKLGDYPVPSSLPSVSVLIPARNEEANIGLCVHSLLAQYYPDFEIVVLNDNSGDETGRILANLANEHDRLRVMNGKSLSPGWLGKNWACHQLAQVAKGDLLFFVDADTRHHPHTLRDATAALFAEEVDFLSAIPYQQVVTWAERLVVPVIPWSILSFLPLGLAHRLHTPVLSAAIGQFMVFRRAAYEQVGGHQAVRESIVDDFALGRRIKAEGLRWRLMDGTSRIRCRMYRDAHEVYEGISKNLFAVFENKVVVHVFIWLWLAVVFLEPLIVLAMGLAGMRLPDASFRLAALATLSSLFLWGVAYRRFGVPFYLAFLYPASILLTVGVALRSVVVTLTGRAMWKGRRLSAVKQVRD